ncbi:HNH endonuclease [Helicobacter sp. T3_23-1056]
MPYVIIIVFVVLAYYFIKFIMWVIEKDKQICDVSKKKELISIWNYAYKDCYNGLMNLYVNFLGQLGLNIDNEAELFDINDLKKVKKEKFQCKMICDEFDIDKNEETLSLLCCIWNLQKCLIYIRANFSDLLEKFESFEPERDRLEKELFIELGIKGSILTNFYFYYESATGKKYHDHTILLDNIFFNLLDYIDDYIETNETKKYQRNLLNSELREYIKERDDYTCQICGKSQNEYPHLSLEIDHIIPIAKGGKTTEDNLQVLCSDCNKAKGKKIVKKIIYDE